MSRRRFICLALAATCWLEPARLVTAAETNSAAITNLSPATFTHQNFEAARKKHLADTNNLEAAWQFARASFEEAEFSSNNTQRAALAEPAIALCRYVIQKKPELAAAHYYLGMNLGQLARTKTLGALSIVDEMEAVFKKVRSLDPKFDHAGPARNLGLLYLEAPTTFSIGDKAKAREYLAKCVTEYPGYPENYLTYLEALLHWDDTAEAQKIYDQLQKTWPQAKKDLTGNEWKGAWLDWEKRRTAAEKKLQK